MIVSLVGPALAVSSSSGDSLTPITKASRLHTDSALKPVRASRINLVRGLKHTVLCSWLMRCATQKMIQAAEVATVGGGIDRSETEERGVCTLQLLAHARLFSLQRALFVRILTGIHVGTIHVGLSGNSRHWRL